VGGYASFILRKSGGWPMCAPCLMRRLRFPDAGLPSGRLLVLTKAKKS